LKPQKKIVATVGVVWGESGECYGEVEKIFTYKTLTKFMVGVILTDK
jgi:hypothetical protein